MKADIRKYPKVANRKIKIQIDKWDTWNLDSTLALIILPALIQLRNTKHGFPSEFANVGGDNGSMQESFDFYKETHNDAFEEGVKRWGETLDKMIWSFQQIALEDYDSKYHHGNMETDWVKTPDKHLNPLTGVKEHMYQMVDKNPTKHWYDHEGHTMHEERIQEGLDLFAKYYRSLWD